MTDKKLNNELLKIVHEHFIGIDTLEQQMNDSLDFHEVSVWSLESALKAAYELGVKEDKKYC